MIIRKELDYYEDGVFMYAVEPGKLYVLAKETGAAKSLLANSGVKRYNCNSTEEKEKEHVKQSTALQAG